MCLEISGILQLSWLCFLSWWCLGYQPQQSFKKYDNNSLKSHFSVCVSTQLFLHHTQFFLLLKYMIKRKSYNDNDSALAILKVSERQTYVANADLKEVGMHFIQHQKMANLGLERCMVQQL